MTSQQATVQGPTAHQPGRHPGLALAVIATAQLMIVLDATIVNIALPKMQSALHFSATDLSWVLNAYTLTFGGLLLLGGRAGDILGRRRVFIFGVALFTLASFLGGFAQSSAWLLAARALQGVGGAIAAPTSLALISTNFEEGPERNRAFGVFAGVSGAGAALGLIAGGMLTSWLSWRWVFFVNVPIGILLALAIPRYIRESERHPGRFDFAGALTSTLGMVTLVYGFIRVSDHGWHNPVALWSFASAIVLLSAFIVIERRSQQPITPLHLFANRNRSTSYVIMLILAAAMFGMFFFLTQFVQEVLGYSALKAGFAFVPITFAIVLTAQLSARFLPKIGPKPFMVAGAVLAAIGLIWLARIQETSGYVGGLLIPMVIFGLGMGFIFVPVTIVALSGVANEESGAASGMLNAMQQVGGSLGLATLVTAFGTSLRNETAKLAPTLPAKPSPDQLAAFKSHVLAHGISSAFQLAAILAVVALVVTVVGIKASAADIDTSVMPGMS